MKRGNFDHTFYQIEELLDGGWVAADSKAGAYDTVWGSASFRFSGQVFQDVRLRGTYHLAHARAVRGQLHLHLPHSTFRLIKRRIMQTVEFTA